jgi:uncharacterized protein (DUF39 family)
MQTLSEINLRMERINDSVVLFNESMSKIVREMERSLETLRAIDAVTDSLSTIASNMAAEMECIS